MKGTGIFGPTATPLSIHALRPATSCHEYCMLRSILTASHPDTITNSYALTGIKYDGSVHNATCSTNGTAWHINLHKHIHYNYIISDGETQI